MSGKDLDSADQADDTAMLPGSKTKYVWREVSKGRWTRDLDEAEIFYASLQKAYEGTGRAFFAITGHISIDLAIEGYTSSADEGDRLTSALRQAWLKLRYSHPTIASFTEYDSNRGYLQKVYESSESSPSDEPHEEWLQKTFHLVTTELSSADWCNGDPPVPKLPTLFVLTTPTGSSLIGRTLVLRSPHDIIDGIGTLQLLGILVKYVTEALDAKTSLRDTQWGSEHANLSPPLRVAAELPEESTDAVTTIFEQAQARSATLLADGPPLLTVPCHRNADVPAHHMRTALRLSQLKTAKIIEACRFMSVSVTHVYHAAAAILLANKQPRSTIARRMQYVSYALVNLRSQCLPPYNSSAHAASVYHCTSAERFGIEFIVPSSLHSNPESDTRTRENEFQRVLKEIKSYYLTNRPSTEPMLLQVAPLLWRQGTPQISREAWMSATPLPVPSPNKYPSISMSSFGIIDTMIPAQLGNFSVHNPWVTGEELGNGIGLFLGTFKGELELSAAFNAAWHNVDEIQMYLHEIQELIELGLGLVV